MSDETSTRVTRLLDAARQGDSQASRDLLPLVYEELRSLARSRMARLAPGQTLQPTALVHEAYLRLVGGGDEHQTPRWDSRGHFFGAAARAMRNILVERARRKSRHKHGGDRKRLSLDEALAISEDPSHDLIALDEALNKLERQDPDRASVVMLRFFGGLTVPQAAEVLGIAPATVDRRWAFARAWLHREMGLSADGMEAAP